jgi:hypothetical protein
MYKLLTMGITVALLCAGARGATIRQDTSWDEGAVDDEFDDWSIDDQGRSGTANGSIDSGGGGDYLEIEAENIGSSPAEDYIFADQAHELTGDYTSLGGSSVQSLHMDLMLDSTDYSVSWYFMYNEGGSEYTWHSDINSLSTGWNSYFVNLDYAGGGWYNTAGPSSATEFNNSLDDVDEVGLLLTYRQNVASQTIGVDNFELNDSEVIPGPQTWMLLGFTFVSMGFTFRDRLRSLTSRILG